MPPRFFKKNVQKALDGILGVEVYINDILISGKNQQEHDERLSMVRTHLAEHGFTINDEKSVISARRVKFLGHIIENGAISPDPDKVEAITDLPAPTN